MLLRRIRIPLVLEHLQSIDEFGARIARLNDLIDIATSSSDIRVGEFLCIFGDQLFAPLFGIGSSLDLIFE